MEIQKEIAQYTITNKSVCLIIPCYNEENRLDIAKITSFIKNNCKTFLCLVNDGSNDGTHKILKEIKQYFPERIFIINFTQNKGKAEAVRVGMLEALSVFDPDFVGYFDADLSTPLETSFCLMEEFEHNENLIISFGSRQENQFSIIQKRIHRYFMGRMVANIITIVLGIKIFDTQCGAKIFKATEAERLFITPFISRWLFDVEIFKRIIKIHGKSEIKSRIKEVPLKLWIHQSGSKIPITYSFRIFYDLFLILKIK